MERFKQLTDRIAAFASASTLFSWDMLTAAPKGSRATMAKLESFFGTETFMLCISDEMKQCLDELEPIIDGQDMVTKGLYKVCKKEYDNFHKIPIQEQEKYNQLVAKAYIAWEAAKKNNDFAAFADMLDEIIRYNIKFIGYRGYKEHPYNTLLDDYEPGMTVKQLDAFFGRVKETIVPLLKKITDGKKAVDTSFRKRHVSIEKQKRISRLLMDVLGYDLDRGMLAESEHPFTQSFGRNVVRITTHYHEDDFFSSIFSVLHETGHALYEQNTMEDIGETLLDTGTSMGIHESQSRFYENVIGRSYAFWEYIYKDLMEILGDDFKDVTVRHFYEAANEVKPSLIRIEADELTYSLHIMVRYEIEKQLVEGKYDIKDLPALWNEKIREYLGIIPDTDTAGVLQDVHWSGGSFGYFPSYSLGNAYAAQLLAYLGKEMDIEGLIREGKIGTITKWLRDHIHQYGRLKEPSELIRAIAGEELNVDYYVEYLNKKFTDVYGL